MKRRCGLCNCAQIPFVMPVIGAREVMRAQLRHLIEMCDHPAVTLQILPFSAGCSHKHEGYDSGARVGVVRVRVSLRKKAGIANLTQIPTTSPARAARKAIRKAPPMYQCGQNGISQDV